jgi:O-antigen ligase
VVYVHRDQPRTWLGLAWALIAGAFLQALVGWIQAMQLSKFVFETSSYGLDKVLRIWWPHLPVEGADRLFLSPIFYDTYHYSGVHGNIAQRNIFAHVLMWGMVAGGWLMGQYRTLGVRCLIFGMLMVVAFPLTWSAGRLVLAYALLWGILLLIWHLRFPQQAEIKRFSVVSSALLILLAILQIWTHEIVELLQYLHIPVQPQMSAVDRLLGDGLGASRYAEWFKAWSAFIDRPWIGYGWGGYVEQGVLRELSGTHTRVLEPSVFTHTHNTPLQLLVETGIFGFLLACAAVLSAVYACIKDTCTPQRSLLLLVLIGISSIHSMFEFPLWYLYMLLPFSIFLNLSPVRAIRIPIRLGLGQAFVFLFSAVVVWQVYIGSQAYVFLLKNLSTRLPSLSEYSHWAQTTHRWMLNPLWEAEAEQMWVIRSPIPNDPKERQEFRRALERQRAYYPQALILHKLASLDMIENKPQQALWHMRLLVASFPDQAPAAYKDLNNLRKLAAAQPSVEFLQRVLQHSKLEDRIQETIGPDHQVTR